MNKTLLSLSAVATLVIGATAMTAQAAPCQRLCPACECRHDSKGRLGWGPRLGRRLSRPVASPLGRRRVAPQIVVVAPPPPGATMNGAAIAVMATATIAATIASTGVVTGASRRLLFSSQALCLAASFMAGRRDQSPSDQGSCATRRGRRALHPPSWTARSITLLLELIGGEAHRARSQAQESFDLRFEGDRSVRTRIDGFDLSDLLVIGAVDPAAPQGPRLDQSVAELEPLSPAGFVAPWPELAGRTRAVR